MARKNYHLISGSMMLLSGLSFAGAMGSASGFNPGFVPLVAVVGGPSFVKPTGFRSVDFGTFSNHYLNNSDTQTLGTWGVMLGLRKGLTKRFGFELGGSYYQDSGIIVKEKVLLLGSADLYNFNGFWNVKTRRALATLRTVFDVGAFGLKQYFHGEVGSSFNEGYNYREQVILVDDSVECTGSSLVTGAFGQSSRAMVSWSVGAGVGHEVGPFDFEVYYQLANLGAGAVSFGDGRTLSTNHIHASQVLFRLTYMFERMSLGRV